MTSNKVFIVAEAGVNHNGSLNIAKKLIDVASKAGADAIKFQTFDAESLAKHDAPKASYQIKNSFNKESQFKMLKKLEFTKKMHNKCFKYCKKKKILFLSSAFSIENLKYLNSFKLQIIKIPSGEITNTPFLKFAGKLKKNIFLSTGMSNMKEIKKALTLINNSGTKKNKITILQCNTAYPTPLSDVNLKAMLNIKRKLKVNIGYSDHTDGFIAALGAVALGAKVIEKHFTLNKKMQGPDHKASLNPTELREFCKKIRIMEKVLGSSVKKATISEKKNIKIVRKSLVASTFIKKGQKFNKKNITSKRPGTGLSPIYYEKVMGKKAIRDFMKDEFIKI